MPYTWDVLAGALEGLLPELSVQRLGYLHVADGVGKEVRVVVCFQGISWDQQRSWRGDVEGSPSRANDLIILCCQCR